MTIETKFNIGDEVCFIEKNQVRYGTILGIWAERAGMKYGLVTEENIRLIYVEECSLFPTKEELLKSL